VDPVCRVWSEWTLLGRRGWSVREVKKGMTEVAKDWKEELVLGEDLVGAYTLYVGNV